MGLIIFKWRTLLRHRNRNMILLKWISEMVKILAGFIWLRIGTGFGLL
jgi:hypothetical protein